MQAASSRTHQGEYLPFGWLCSPSLLSSLISPFPVTVSALRGAERDPVGVVRVVVVVGVAVAVDIPEVVRVARVRGTEPPVRRCAGQWLAEHNHYYYGSFAYRVLSDFITAFMRRSS